MIAPIVIFTYNRLIHTQKTIQALQLNELAEKSDLIIYSDGPKDYDNDKNAVKQLREYLNTITGFRSISIVEREINNGLAFSVITGVTEIVNRFGKIIVLEDDMVVSPYFLQFMNEALSLYENDERVISIHGYLYPVKAKLPETFFIKGASCWGWATWQRGWSLFESDGRVLLEKLKTSSLERRFNYDNTAYYTNMLKDQITGKINSWAVRWYATALLNDKLTLYPGVSLVQNIGLDNSGTHCGSTDRYNTDVTMRPVKLERIPSVENDYCYEAFKEYFKSLQIPFLKKLLLKLMSFKKYISFWEHIT